MIVKFVKKYEEQVSYLFFGVLTTIVNYLSFALLRAWWGDGWIHVVNAATFVLATLFAYVTNKLFVFKSREWKLKSVISEILSFFVSRISSYLVEAIGLYICVDVFDVGKYEWFMIDGTMLAKIVLSFVAVILNYFFSKFFVFKKSKKDETNEVTVNHSGV